MGNRLIQLLCFCFLLLPFVSPAQSTDERLFEELKKKVQLDSYYDSALVYKSGGEAIRLAQKMGDKGKEAEIHIFYGNYFYYSQNFKKAEEEFNKAYYLAYNGNNTKVLRLARIRLTYLEETEGKTEEAEQHFQSILEEAKQEKDPANEIECYNALALISERNNKSDEAMKNYLNGLRTAEENKLDYYTAVLLNNIGLLKLNSDKTQEALADFERGLEITNRINNPRLGGHIQNNIGLVYLRLNKTDEGLSHFKAAVQYAHAINHPKELAVAFINYSSVLLQVKRSDESIAYLDSAIQVLESNNMKFELSKALLGKAQVMIELKNYNEAIHLASEAREVALVSKNLEDRAFSHRVLYRVYEKMNLFELALKEYKTYRDLDDSLKETRSNRMFNELQVEYDVEKKEYQLEQEKNKSLLLESENQLKKVRIRILIFASVAILILLFIVFYIRNQRNIRKEQERFSQQLIANLEKERSRIARD
ncbi:MAG: tetratricopeptide repeat protein, partial [Flavobacteriales bacterium]|nr:tetratricopeptide repeat protein [Flavobacteriales bacterium]